MGNEDSTRGGGRLSGGTKLLCSTLGRARSILARLEGIYWSFVPTPSTAEQPAPAAIALARTTRFAPVATLEDVQQIAMLSNHVVRTSDRLARRKDGLLHRTTIVIADCVHEQCELDTELRQLLRSLMPDDGSAAREAKILIGATEPLAPRRIGLGAEVPHARCIGIDSPVLADRIASETRPFADAMRVLLDVLKARGDLGAIALDKCPAALVNCPRLLRVWTESVFKQATLAEAAQMLLAFDDAQRAVMLHDEAREAHFIAQLLAHAHPSQPNVMLLDARHVHNMRRRLLNQQLFVMVVASRRGLRRLVAEGLPWCAIEQWE